MSRLASIGCEVKYDNILEDKNTNMIEEMTAYLITLGTFFLFSSSSLFVIINVLKKASKVFSKIDIEELAEEAGQTNIINFCDYIKGTICVFCKKFNINFIGIFILLSLNILIGFNYSFGVLFRGFEDVIFGIDETFNERSTLYLIIFFKTYLVFLINYYCLIIAKNRVNF